MAVPRLTCATRGHAQPLALAPTMTVFNTVMVARCQHLPRWHSLGLSIDHCAALSVALTIVPLNEWC